MHALQSSNFTSGYIPLKQNKGIRVLIEILFVIAEYVGKAQMLIVGESAK